jgi:hypothetical protein
MSIEVPDVAPRVKRDRICPLLSIADQTEKSCIGERCLWWNGDARDCAIKHALLEIGRNRSHSDLAKPTVRRS